MSIKRISVWTLSLSGIVIVGIALYTLIQEPEFGYTPSLDQVLNVDRRPVERTSGNGISPVSHEKQEIRSRPAC